MSIEQEFQEAVDAVRNLPKDGPYKPSQDEQLALYSLFKQATVGKCNTPKPGVLKLTEKAKWEAWQKLGDMSKEEAMRKYVEAFKRNQQKAAS